MENVSPNIWKKFNVFFVQWQGTNKPIGVLVDGMSIDSIKTDRNGQGIAYHHTNPMDLPRHWKAIGLYQSVYNDYGFSNGRTFNKHEALLFVKKQEDQAQKSA